MKSVGLWAAGIGALASVGLLTVEQGFADENDRATKCTPATLKGRYLFAGSGTLFPPAFGVTEVSVGNAAGFHIFNGNSTGQDYVTFTLNGIDQHVPSPNVLTYTLDVDCTGTYAVEGGGPTFDIFVSPTGNRGQILVGANWGVFATLIRGTATIPPGATTVTTTYASLNGATPNFDTTAHTGLKQKLFLGTPETPVGYVSGTASSTQVVINCSIAPGAGGAVISRRVAASPADADRAVRSIVRAREASPRPSPASVEARPRALRPGASAATRPESRRPRDLALARRSSWVLTRFRYSAG